MSRVFFDTNLFIYLFEDASARGEIVANLITRLAKRGDEIITSTVTLGELLVKPLEAGDTELAVCYEAVVYHPGIRLVSFDASAARHYARIRQDRSIKPPDAIQLACASAANADVFVTNDESLTKKNVPGIQFIVTLGKMPL